ncbi:GPW/gp25 family protein [Uliginosibacterium gangwonense]|uniref:GPW/gp25 family protein n=1 Tax=Uliginosibacterium gangwonense TaxID=392736 RepID=UPI0003640FF3|nr:GPW/gp25 family protein [Uliginosibacterium gangwonense]
MGTSSSSSTVMATTGMNPETGLFVSGLAHIQMCIGQILNTPLGSCVARREFGSLLPFMIDAPLNPLTRIRVVAACAAAILRWEPRVTLKTVYLTQPTDSSSPGTLIVDLAGTVVATQTPFNLRVPLGAALKVSS